MALFDFTGVAKALGEIAVELRRLADQRDADRKVGVRKTVPATLHRSDPAAIAMRVGLYDQGIASGLTRQQSRERVRDITQRQKVEDHRQRS